VPAAGARNAYVPGILTAAGAFTLFAVTYAAHGIYGFIGPALAFGTMGAIGLATIAASLVHGPALAGLGLAGSYLTPVLVASSAPNPWALFVFLAIILATTGVIARLRDWTLLMGAGFAGAGVWSLLYVGSSYPPDLAAVLFINAVTLGVLALVWLRSNPRATNEWDLFVGVDRAAIVPAILIALTAVALGVQDSIARGPIIAAVLIVALVAVALYRYRAIPLLYGGGAATLLIYARTALGADFDLSFWGGGVSIEGLPVAAGAATFIPLGILLAALFLATGLWQSREYAATSRYRSASWAGWAVLVPLGILVATWLSFGNPGQDFLHAFVALVLTAAFAVGGEAIARAEQPPHAGGLSVSFVVAGAGAAAVLAVHMAFGPGMTTILTGLLAAAPAYATRHRRYPVLGWLSAAIAALVLARIAIDPSIIGEDALGVTPVFNALLPGYGLPALAVSYAAWQIARTTDGRPRLVLETFAALFALLTVAILVRHAMNGGTLEGGVLDLAEQSIYTLIVIGAAAILIALDAHAPSPVFRYGSMAAGLVSVAFIAVQHLAALNPIFTDESTGGIPIFNLLFLAYLLPATALAGLALYARGKRPYWYVATLALLAALLAFAYATLSIRRMFQGEFIAEWRGFGQLETYTYSAVWLALGVALLVAGMRLRSQVVRIASAALVLLAIAKVFLFDMAELEGVLRALSFIGLGGVLIGIGLFYQRTLAAAGR
jgi:uncharacterized membrane protein